MTHVFRKFFSEEVERKRLPTTLRKVLSEGDGNAASNLECESVSGSSAPNDAHTKVIRHVKTPIELLPRFPTLTWTHSGSSEAEIVSNVRLTAEHEALVRGILRGLNRRLAERCDVVLKRRREGTMTDVAEGRELPMCDEDIRRRQEHVKGIVERMPALVSNERDADEWVVSEIRNALVAGLQELYSIVWSMECRKYDVCSGDVHALFAWLKLFEDATRLYLAMCEACIYSAHALDDNSQLTGELELHARHALKRDIVRQLDWLQTLKRRLLALDRNAGTQMGSVRAGVDAFSTRLLRLLRAEHAQLAALLRDGDTRSAVRTRLVHAMCAGAHAREAVWLLLRGVRSTATRSAWLRALRDDGGVGAGGELIAARVARCHAMYVRAFTAARREYAAMYERRARVLDSRVVATR